eukprot:GHVU01107820.1.p1 GENE.GHVU01107820.1~~GHVU01107820.1.p1  ORF type:complete len:325 (-),score=26.28 GHVU01107820.1:120-1094(-)
MSTTTMPHIVDGDLLEVTEPDRNTSVRFTVRTVTGTDGLCMYRAVCRAHMFPTTNGEDNESNVHELLKHLKYAVRKDDTRFRSVCHWFTKAGETPAEDDVKTKESSRIHKIRGKGCNKERVPNRACPDSEPYMDAYTRHLNACLVTSSKRQPKEDVYVNHLRMLYLCLCLRMRMVVLQPHWRDKLMRIDIDDSASFMEFIGFTPRAIAYNFWKRNDRVMFVMLHSNLVGNKQKSKPVLADGYHVSLLIPSAGSDVTLTALRGFTVDHMDCFLCDSALKMRWTCKRERDCMLDMNAETQKEDEEEKPEEKMEVDDVRELEEVEDD